MDCRSGRAPALELKADNAIIANGLAWPPDAATVYWADTPSHTVQAWNWDAETNAITHRRVFKQWPGKPHGWQPGAPDASGYGGRPDAAAVDVEGNYDVAMYEGARVLKISPAGDVLANIAVPAQRPAMPVHETQGQIPS